MIAPRTQVHLSHGERPDRLKRVYARLRRAMAIRVRGYKLSKGLIPLSPKRRGSRQSVRPALRMAATVLALVSALALSACNSADTGRMQGWVEADFVFVGPDEAGRVQAMHVREGDTAAAGAPFFAEVPRANAIRLSYSLPTDEQIEEGVARLARLIGRVMAEA